jgi:O-antigen ligase
MATEELEPVVTEEAGWPTPAGGKDSVPVPLPASPTHTAVRGRSWPAVPVVLLALVLVLLPLRELPAWTVAGALPFSVGVLDVALLALAGVCLPRLLRQARDGPSPLALTVPLVLLTLLGMALVAHPSWPGLLEVARIGAATVVALAVRESGSTRTIRVLLGSLVGGAVLQTVVVVGQLARGRPLGWTFLGEAQYPLYKVGLAVAPRGTFQHPYPLAGFVVLAMFTALTLGLRVPRPRLFLCALTIGAVPLGVTYSRSCVLAVVLGAASLAVGVRRHGRVLVLGLVAVAAGALVPALVLRAGWQSRLSSTSLTVSSGDADALSAGRLSAARASLRLTRSEPLLGVGPGRFQPGSQVALRAGSPGNEIVHNLPLFVAAEAGIPAGIVLTGILVAVGVRAFRSGPLARALYLALLPFVLLDRFTYDGPQGLVLTAVWLALVELVARTESVTADGAAPSSHAPSRARPGSR